MTYQGQPAGHSARGQRLNQPSDTRELRKQPKRTDMVQMSDGLYISARVYQHLRSTAHQKFRGSHDGCSQAVRRVVSHSDWELIETWMDAHRPQFGHGSKQNDGLMATLIGYTAAKLQRSIPDVFDSILKDRSAQILLPSN